MLQQTNAQILIWLFVCHFLADYTPLSTPWMLNAKRFGKPMLPILAHAATHTVLMSLVLVWYIGFVNLLPYLATLQLVSHFLIDIWKGKMNVWFPILQPPSNRWHWIMFGFDQLLHALVIVAMFLCISK